MICYQDRTFCTFGLICKNGHSCKNVLTEQVKADASTWWGKEGAPIAVYTSFPECFRPWFEEVRDESGYLSLF